MNGLMKKEANGILPFAEEFLKQTRLDLDDAKMSFFKIGFRLNEAVRGNYCSVLGYNDIYELAKNEFGFEKTTTKNLMAINRTYCVHGVSGYTPYSLQLEENYKKYSQTQLVEMLTLTESERKHIPEDFTISELRDYKKLCNRILNSCGVYEYIGMHYHEIIDDPRTAVKKYRGKKEKEKICKTETLEGQIYINESGEMAEYRQSGGETLFHSSSPVRLLIEQEESDAEIGEVLEECADIDKEESAADAMVRLREKYAMTQEEFAAAGKSFPDPIPETRIPRHVFKNKTEREAFIRNIKNYPVIVLHSEELQLTVHRCDLANGAKIYRTEYKEYLDWNKNTIDRECLCLVDCQSKAERTGHNAGGTFSPKTYTLNGTAPTYIIDYIAKFKDEI